MRINKNTPRQYYTPTIDIHSSCLITGNCLPVKQKLTSELINGSYSHRAVVVLDFEGSLGGLYDTFIHYSTYRFHVDHNTYKPFTGDEKKVLLYINELATALGYPHSEIVQAVNYWQLVTEINRLRGVHANSLEDLVSYYYSIAQVQSAIDELVKQRIISLEQLDYIHHQIEANAKGAKIIDNVMADITFRLTQSSNLEEAGYSLNSIDSQSIVYMYVNSMRNSVTEALIQSVTEDTIALSTPVSLVVNMGRVTRTPAIETLVKLTTTHGIPTLYITDDLFLDSEDTNSFRNLFDFNVLGAHNGTSAKYIQDIFPTRRVMEEHYSRTYDRRLLTNHTLDLIFGLNHQDTISRVPIETPTVRAEYITRMPPNNYLIMNNKSNTYRLGSV